MKASWQRELKDAVREARLLFDIESRKKLSRDYFHFSPILSRELEGNIADCIAQPETEEELDAILEIAVRHRIPVTVRGSGTGNYGQAVPLAGGIVLDMSGLNQVLELSGNTIRAQAGARMGKLEAVARQNGKELRVYPSTFHTATVGGFICGGSGGIGSITWGTIWDGVVQGMTIKTMEDRPRLLTVQGEETATYIHNYGVSGIVTELTLVLAPKHEWTQWAVSFGGLDSAVKFGLSIAQDSTVNKRLISVHEWPIPAYFLPLKLPQGKAVVLLEVEDQHQSALLDWVHEWNGTVEVTVDAANYHRGIGVSDFTWNHTTLWARKADTELTYLQARFSPDYCLTQMEQVKAAFPECIIHVEMMRNQGKLVVAGLPIVRYTTDERMEQLIFYCESIGVSVANPHTWRLEFGGRSPELERLSALKQQNDPYGLLNPRKLELSLSPDQAM